MEWREFLHTLSIGNTGLAMRLAIAKRDTEIRAMAEARIVRSQLENVPWLDARCLHFGEIDQHEIRKCLKNAPKPWE